MKGERGRRGEGIWKEILTVIEHGIEAGQGSLEGLECNDGGGRDAVDDVKELVQRKHFSERAWKALEGMVQSGSPEVGFSESLGSQGI